MCSPLLIRADASPEIGTGHVMRMLALAQAWQRRGGDVKFAAAEMPSQLVARLEAENVEVIRLGTDSSDIAPVGSEQDAIHTAKLAKQIGATWVVADGYVFKRTFQCTIRESGLRCAIVTDFDYCDPWQCELILNQNPHATHERYCNLIPDGKHLLGTRFALLRKEFLDADTATNDPLTNRPPRILLTLGGSDPTNATGRVLTLLESCNRPGLDIHVIVGAANPHRGCLEQTAKESPHRVELLSNVDDMPRQYMWADGIIGAGGSSCWEWLYLGLPGAILVIAENQVPIYEALTSDGVATGLGTCKALMEDAFETRKQLEQFLAGIDNGQRRPRQYRHLVDGYGASRVAAALDTEIWLRRATVDDRELYFAWANDSEVRRNSLCSDEIDWPSHCRWFDAQLSTPDAKLFVGMQDEKPVGQIRFNRTAADEWNVGFSVAGAARGTGIGKELVRLGTGWMISDGLSPLVATVKVENEASARCFTRFGWEPSITDDSQLLRFRRT